ncbi:hypothetical protein TYRP_004473, partial [Tyrophagus putrescentiae]
LVYVSALVVWSSSSNSSSQSSSSTANQNDTSSRSAEGTQRSTQLLNSSSHHNRQLKNHLPYEEALPAMPPTPSALNDLTKAAERRTLRTSLEDIFLSVKTTRIFHPTRLEVILNTWFRLAKNQTYFFTDAEDEVYNRKSGGHLINTNCSASHNRKALCCKMSVEFDSFLASGRKWWCHFDDDNYVNIPRLVELLRTFSPLDDWYLGKPSVRQPLEIEDRDAKKKVHFSFATGGAGFCVSRALALKMVPIASDGKLISVGEKIRLPDDVTVGYIIEHMLAKKLTVIDAFHSHLEPMALLPKSSLDGQVSFSYSGNGSNRNVLSIKKSALKRSDPTRFYSLHCRLFPEFCKY